MQIKDPNTITAEEDEEQMIMRRLRNSCDELRRGFRSEENHIYKNIPIDMCDVDGWTTECRGLGRRLTNPRSREKTLNSQKKRFL